MEEELENIDATVEEKGTDPAKTEKTFTQAEINKVVQERVKRERDTVRKLEEELTQRKEEYQSQVDTYETFLKKLVEEEMQDFPEPVKKLLFRLSLMEQLEYIMDENNRIEKKPIPSTPRAKVESVSEPRKIKKII